jgi:hypothetical protein
MLIPRYSLRWMLGVVTVCAVISTIFSFAIQGQAWALAFSLALGLLITCFLLYGIMFVIAYELARLLRVTQRQPHDGSPFASETQPPPRQIVPLTDSD